jgi:hypothetical protein
MLHSFCRCRNRVDSRLLVVRSQTASLTPGPSFAHNLDCICPNGSCKAIFGIYTSRNFQRYKEHFKARCFAFCYCALKLRESRRTPSSHFWEYESHPPTCPKWGCDIGVYDPSVGFRKGQINVHSFRPRFLTGNHSVHTRSIVTSESTRLLVQNNKRSKRFAMNDEPDGWIVVPTPNDAGGHHNACFPQEPRL